MRIAIVNDMRIAVEALRRTIVAIPDYNVAWVAYDGVEAVTKCAADTPDLILMDVLMPNMDGVEATKHIMNQSPCAIMMVTASVNRYAGKVFEAMGYGALDAINTPIWGGTELVKKISTIAKLIGKSPRHRIANKPNDLPLLIAIGASTGGPQALVRIICQFPPNFPAAIVIIQHLDAQFTPSLAAWLNEQTPLSVQIANPGSHLQPGKIFLAAKNQHLVLRPTLTLDYEPEPLACSYHPSIDVFFESAVKYWTGKGVGVLLTGMGRDGAQGLKMMRDAGWHTIAQDSRTCVVYGMPKAAAELNAAIEILPIEAIASACIKSVNSYH
ncbi:chemotaxis response regulator protein-glutamate methylesterase [Anabaena azotica]|uniref:Protein-glutamate methylesterase/protein-glutamine glutaminase n=1 Tax=Anabaena azotica FACHB-119 TaxID=947527 RepID=A0ABR8D2Z5_9NOST|nr:chemotaxis response regulator protein-glutamate methylesterase [Anabaena azotica]MBD2500816.1 chemotaxis response regulator protein-glutamate methylesterase [Anabaena azotica FACHB-119]